MTIVPIIIPAAQRKKNANLIEINEPLEKAEEILKNHGGLEGAIGLYELCFHTTSTILFFGLKHHITGAAPYIITQNNLSLVFPPRRFRSDYEKGRLYLPDHIKVTGHGPIYNPDDRQFWNDFAKDYLRKIVRLDFNRGKPDGVSDWHSVIYW